MRENSYESTLYKQTSQLRPRLCRSLLLVLMMEGKTRQSEGLIVVKLLPSSEAVRTDSSE